MSFDSESNPQGTDLANSAGKTEDSVFKKPAKDKKEDLRDNYQIIAVVSTLLAAVASSLLSPIGNQSSYTRFSSSSLSLLDLSDRLLAACYTSLILSIEATCLTCYLKYRLSTLSDYEICRIWRIPGVKIDRSKPCFANYEIRAISVIFWFCFVSAILLMLGTILVYMYWQLPPVWFYIWSTFSSILLVLFLPLLTLRLYRTITGSDYTF